MQTSTLFLCFMLLGCFGEHRSDAPNAQPATITPLGVATPDTLHLDTAQSEVAWKGTKLWGRGQHTGTVPVKSGHLLLEDDRPTGGFVIIDMTSIGITDIPPDQPEPIALLTKHLEDPLFFDVARYPEARFEISGSTAETIAGHLTIKDVTRHISVPLERIELDGQQVFRTRFRFDRFDWNIAYEGGFGATRFAARNFVDRHIELDITIVPAR